jgi:hypothetical protein
VIPLQDLFDMTAKPVRDLLFSKARNQQRRLPIPIGTIREIDIETPSSSPKGESETISTTQMKDMMILNERGRSSQESGTKLDSSAEDKNKLPQARTGRPISFKKEDQERFVFE